jgi:hypothetical protein
MSDLTVDGDSDYTTSGTPDTYSARSDGTAGSFINAATVNGVAQAITEAQALLGNALTLKGAQADLVSRLAQILADDGSIRNGTSFPSSPVPLVGDLFYRTDGTKTLYVYNGTSWDTMFDGGGAGAIDHGGLVGLTDDDHSIYIKADASRDFSGDPQIEKNVPLFRWKGSEANAEEYGIFEDTGDFVIAENTGTEGTPTWTDRMRYDRSLTKWTLTGDVTLSADLVVTNQIESPEIITPTIAAAGWTNANHTHAGTTTGGKIGYTALNTGTASQNNITSNTAFSHNQYIIDVASESSTAGSPGQRIISWGNQANSTSPVREMWVESSAWGGENIDVDWIYLTASENPSIWAMCDSLSGNLISIWESEDPADYEFPHRAPMTALPGTVVHEITTCLNDPNVWQLANKEMDLVVAVPQWIRGSIYDHFQTPKELLAAFVEKTFLEKGKWLKEDLTDIRGIDAISNITPQQRRWRYQLWLREISRILENRQRPKLGKFLTKRFKYYQGKLVYK